MLRLSKPFQQAYFFPPSFRYSLATACKYRLIFSFVISTLCSDDIAHLAFHNVESHKLWNRFCFCLSLGVIVLCSCAQRQYAGGIDDSVQLAAPQIIILIAKRNIVQTADIVQHCQKIQAFGMPLSFIAGENFTALKGINNEWDIAHFLHR